MIVDTIDRRWMLVQAFWRYLQVQTSTYLRKCIVRMAEQLFLYQKKRSFVTRTLFIQIVKYSLSLSGETANERINLKFLDSLYDSFDPYRRDELEWRKLLYMIRTLSWLQISQRNDSLKDYLLCAFKFYTAEDDKIVDDINFNKSVVENQIPIYCEGRLHLSDLRYVVEFIVRPDKVFSIMEFISISFHQLFPDHWAVQSTNMDTKFVVSFFSWRNILERMISKTDLLDSNEFYPTAFVTICQSYSRLSHIEKHIVEQNDTQKRRSIQFWAMKIRRRHRLRFIVQKIFENRVRRTKHCVFDALAQNALRDIAVLTLQKFVRGFVERLKVGQTRARKSAVIYLQSAARCMLERHSYRRLISVRKEAAITIQRNYRGWRGKQIALNRFKSESDQMQIHMDHIQYLRHWQSLNNSFGLLQKRFRSLHSVALESEQSFKRQREKEMNETIEMNVLSIQTERRIYEQALKEYYDGLEKERAMKREADETFRQHNISVRLLATKHEFENRRLERVKRDEAEQMQHELQRDIISQEWRQKSEEQSSMYRQYCIHCYRNPRSVTERSLCTRIKTAISKRKIEILEAADDRDEPMEYVEAEKMALNHVIATMVEEEKFRILGLMEESLLKHDQEHDDRLVQSKVQEKKQQELMERQACMIITRAARIWVARLILLKKCEDMFEKIFDENFRAFYYRNKITGDASWLKPKVMKDNDLRVHDKWVVLRDAQDFPYYYNPCSMRMSWSHPINCQQAMCSNQSVLYTWWKQFPIPSGPCEYFADPINSADNRTFCNRCWRSLHLSRSCGDE